MKFAKAVAWLLAAAAAAVCLGTVGLCFANLDGPSLSRQVPPQADAVCQELMEALAAGDEAGASSLLYGQPALGLTGQLADPLAQRVWQSFLDSISYEFSGPSQLTDTGYQRQVTVTAMDVPEALKTLSSLSRQLLDTQLAAAADPQVYYINGTLDPQVAQQILEQALSQLLSGSYPTTTQVCTLELICQEEKWYVCPDPGLMQILSGGVA